MLLESIDADGSDAVDSTPMSCNRRGPEIPHAIGVFVVIAPAGFVLPHVRDAHSRVVFAEVGVAKALDKGPAEIGTSCSFPIGRMRVRSVVSVVE